MSKRSIVNFAEIRRLRNAGGWTLEEMATRAGWKGKSSRARWADMENGRTPDPRISTLVEIADALGVGIEEILFPRGKR